MHAPKMCTVTKWWLHTKSVDFINIFTYKHSIPCLYTITSVLALRRSRQHRHAWGCITIVAWWHYSVCGSTRRGIGSICGRNTICGREHRESLIRETIRRRNTVRAIWWGRVWIPVRVWRRIWISERMGRTSFGRCGFIGATRRSFIGWRLSSTRRGSTFGQ
jgi:hypothetical protein